jgi:hypothetical protein
MEIIKNVVLIVSKTSNPVSQSQDITHVEKKRELNEVQNIYTTKCEGKK